MSSYVSLHRLRFLAPKKQNTLYNLYCKSSDNPRWNIDSKPFERKADLWFLSVCVAVNQGLEPKDTILNHDMGYLSVFRDEPWRFTVLLSVVIDYESDASIDDKGSKIMSLLNRLAASGLPEVVEMIRDGDNSKPIWNLTDGIRSLLSKN